MDVFHNIADWFTSCCWNQLLPCGQNYGFGASTFISFSVAFNVAIAKWELLRKSLIDANSRLSQHFQQELDKATSAAIKADESLRLTEVDMRKLCAMAVDPIYKRTEEKWEKAQPWAVTSAVIGALFLFFQLSMGLLGIILFLVPGYIWKITGVAKKEINSKIQAAVENHVNSLKLAQAQQSEAREEKIDHKLDSLSKS